MTSLPAVPHSLPRLARLAGSLAARPFLPSSRLARRLARCLARSQLSPATCLPVRRPGLLGPPPRSCLPGGPGPLRPQPRAPGARCSRAAGRTHGVREAPTGRLRGDPGQWRLLAGPQNLSPPLPPLRRPRPRQPSSPPRRFPLLSRPPPPAAARRAPPAKLSLFSFSPQNPPASAAGGRDWDFLRSQGWGWGPLAATGPGL